MQAKSGARIQVCVLALQIHALGKGVHDMALLFLL